MKYVGYRAGLCLIFLALLPLLNPIIRGDSVEYYAYLSSLVLDGDLRFENQFSHGNKAFLFVRQNPDGTWKNEMRTPTGYLADFHSIGPSLLWFPFFLLAHLLVKTASLLGHPIPADGYSPPYLILISIGSGLYAFSGLMLSFSLSKRFVSERSAFIATVALWLASPLILYMTVLPNKVHVFSVFTVSLFLWNWARTRERRNYPDWFFLGACAGLMTLVYQVDIAFGAVMLIESVGKYYAAVSRRDWESFRKLNLGHFLFLTGAVLLLIPHIIIKKILYGSFFSTGYAWDWYWTSPYLWQIFFSSRKGIISWHPVFFFALAGLFFAFKRDKKVTLSFVSCLIVFFYICASYANWHGTSGFGYRRALSAFPVFVFGLSSLIDFLGGRFKTAWVNAVIFILILWNIFFAYQWCLGLVPRRDHISWRQMTYNQFFVVPRSFLSTIQAYVFSKDRMVKEVMEQDYEKLKNKRWRANIHDR